MLGVTLGVVPSLNGHQSNSHSNRARRARIIPAAIIPLPTLDRCRGEGVGAGGGNVVGAIGGGGVPPVAPVASVAIGIAAAGATWRILGTRLTRGAGATPAPGLTVVVVVTTGVPDATAGTTGTTAGAIGTAAGIAGAGAGRGGLAGAFFAPATPPVFV